MSCYCRVLRSTANINQQGIIPSWSIMMSVSKVSWPTAGGATSVLSHSNYKSLWLEFPLFRHLHLHLLTGTPRRAATCDLLPSLGAGPRGRYGGGSLGDGHGGKKTFSRWKTTRRQSWWRRRPGPPCSSLLRRARGRPVCCHQQWGGNVIGQFQKWKRGWE